MIQAMDHEIGRLMDSLRVLNQLDSTDFIFIGDNGNTPRTAQVADLTKAKGTIYEYGVHVPLIISGPSVVNPNRVSKALVNSVDLFATIIENFGFKNWQQYIPTNKPVDSKSIMPIIKNSTDSIRPWAFCELFKLTTDSSDGKAIKNKAYKLIRFDYGAEAFYHLSNDSLENVDLLKQAMTSNDVNNYKYLCQEMNALLGKNSDCKTAQLELNKLEGDLISVAPNPCNNMIYFDFNQALDETIQIELIDVLGHCVHSQIVHPNVSTSLDVSGFNAGLYSVLFHTTKQILCVNLVVK
jgi:hypothetical protein